MEGWVPNEASKSALDHMGSPLSFFSVARQELYNDTEEGSTAQLDLQVGGLCVVRCESVE